MNRMRTILLLVAGITIAFAPVSAASTAHPHLHTYFGASHVVATASVAVDQDPVHVNSYRIASASVSAICADVTPIVTAITPLTIDRDNDTESGIGGACFSYVTDHGDDTGKTLYPEVYEQILAPNMVSYVACVDVNGDGLCVDATGDQVDLCTSTTHLSEITGLPCSVYADPAAADPTVYVIVVSTIGVNESDPLTGVPAAGGSILLRE